MIHFLIIGRADPGILFEQSGKIFQVLIAYSLCHIIHRHLTTAEELFCLVHAKLCHIVQKVLPCFLLENRRKICSVKSDVFTYIFQLQRLQVMLLDIFSGFCDGFLLFCFFFLLKVFDQIGNIFSQETKRLGGCGTPVKSIDQIFSDFVDIQFFILTDSCEDCIGNFHIAVKI